MIQTLRITSVVAAILAGVFFVFPVVYGVRSDERIDRFLKQPSVREKFDDVADNKAKAADSRVSPLVEQAEAFAMYLNPVKAKVQKASIEPKTTSISSKLSVTPKFKVFATSYCAENPELSLALIDEPGRGRHWVRQSSKVGHLFIEQVKDGFVVVKGGQETFELEIEKMPETISLTRTSPVSSLRRGQNPLTSKSPDSDRTTIRRTTNIPQQLKRDSEDDEKMNQFVEKLKDLKKSSASDKTDSALSTEERAARIEELIAKFKSTRVSAEESKKLENMGEELKGNQDDTDSPPLEEDEDTEEDSPPETDKSPQK